MRSRVRTLGIVFVVCLLLFSGSALAVEVNGTITIDAPDGPEVAVTAPDGTDLELDGPDGPNTVEVIHDDGVAVNNATFSSPSPTSVAVDTDEMVGTYSRVTGIEAGSTPLTINPEDKSPVTVEGGIDSIEWQDANVDDDLSETTSGFARDFSYTASSSASVTIATDTSNTKLLAVNETSGTVLDQSTSDSSGTVTFASLDAGTHGVVVRSPIRPQLSNGQPSGGMSIDGSGANISVDVTDDDFDRSHGDSVDVVFYDASDDIEIGTDTLTSAGTASVEWSSVEGGENSWYAVATDSYNEETTSSTYSFETPAELTIRDESNPDEIITDAGNATVTFFGDDDVFERPVENGVVDMSGLPLDQRFIISVQVDDYVTRQAIIESVTQQQDVYLLPETADAVDVRFRLSDPAGRFVPEDTTLFVERPITRDNETVYRTVAADQFGANGYAVQLERDQRYRLRVVSDEGRSRVFSFTSQVDETVELEISELEFDFEAEENYQWNAEIVNEDTINFDYRDPTGATESIQLTITNRTSNEIIYESELEGANVSDSYILSSKPGPQDAFIIEWFGIRNTNEDSEETVEISGSTVVGQSEIPISLPGLSERHQSIIGSFMIVLIGGAFGRSNAASGGIIISIMAGFLFVIGWMPGTVSGIFIAVALALSIVYRMAFSRGGVQ